MSKQPLRLAVAEAERILREAGVASPRADAELLAAHVVGVERTKLTMVPLVTVAVVEELHRLVRERSKGIPLQHITGWAAMGAITVSVGPGVFVPRPETELLLAWGLAHLRRTRQPTVVDLCTGSGVLALAFANARPDATVHAVERDPSALAWARRNANALVGAGDRPVDLRFGDVGDPELLSELDGTVDLVVCNPPYVPEGTPVPVEVAEHDPHAAVFGGLDGLETIRQVVHCAVRLLRPGGALALEHDDTHGEAVPELLRARQVLTEVADHPDLAGRPRFATALRRSLS
ncbi:peptide chain release factor N(5)-glutamine methyltransferase [Actinoalloteichus spitiensis]|uniref:peptide chain release factor N(5)-glutamine methyltransferase n=1 Tax=Actinoalloteichus spitiensis TaxID=252394 RepID=UPI0004751D68|nr:peptide chain release factor N(5)-glutamine methyltransferase [Actinoalloteichus spitiensis]